jgi:hypothetical protein
MATTIERKIYNQTKEHFLAGRELLKEREYLHSWQKGEILDTTVKDIPEEFGKHVGFPTVGVKTGDMGLYLIIHEPTGDYVYLGRACPGDIKSRLSKVRSIMNKEGGKPTDSAHHQGASKMWDFDPDLSNYRYSYITYANRKDCDKIELLVLQEHTKVAETEWAKKLKPKYMTEGHIGL